MSPPIGFGRDHLLAESESARRGWFRRLGVGPLGGRCRGLVLASSTSSDELQLAGGLISCGGRSEGRSFHAFCEKSRSLNLRTVWLNGRLVLLASDGPPQHHPVSASGVGGDGVVLASSCVRQLVVLVRELWRGGGCPIRAAPGCGGPSQGHHQAVSALPAPQHQRTAVCTICVSLATQALELT